MSTDDRPEIIVRPFGGWECPECGCRFAFTRTADGHQCDSCGTTCRLPEERQP